MKICVTADFHGYPPPEIPECDLLLFAGDLGRGQWFGGARVAYDYADWLGELQRERALPVLGVAGNNDFDSDSFVEMPWIYLENEAITANLSSGESLRVWGSPSVPRLKEWAHVRTEPELEELYATIPEDVDIIISHGPPSGYVDEFRVGYHVGSEALLERAQELPNLRLIACGHIHGAHGVTFIPDTNTENKHAVIVANGSYVDHGYRPVNKPIVLDL